MGKGGWETELSSPAPPSALSHVPLPTPVSPVSFSGTPESLGLALRMLMKECLPGALSVHPPPLSPTLPILLTFLSTSLLFPSLTA